MNWQKRYYWINKLDQNLDKELGSEAFMSFLDMVRWIAAFIVLVGHLRGILFGSYGGLTSDERNLSVQAWYFASGFFAEAVVVFFVLSGFLIGSINLRKLSRGTFTPKKYFIDRFSRLYTAFLPAILLTLLLDITGRQLFSDAGFYDGTQKMIVNNLTGYSAFESNLSASNLLATIFMVQGFHVTPLGSNQPLWTISCEFWFYVCFGLGLKFWQSLEKIGSQLPIVVIPLIIIVIITLLGPMFIYYIGLWLVGVSLSFFRLTKQPHVWANLLFFLTALVIIRIYGSAFQNSPDQIMVKNYIVAILFCLLLNSLRNTKSNFLLKLSNMNKRFADLSYSLYLTHYPVMIFLLSAMYSSGLFPEIRVGYSPVNHNGIFIYLVLIFSCLIVAWIFSRYTERNTHYVRNFGYRLFSNRF